MQFKFTYHMQPPLTCSLKLELTKALYLPTLNA